MSWNDTIQLLSALAAVGLIVAGLDQVTAQFRHSLLYAFVGGALSGSVASLLLTSSAPGWGSTFEWLLWVIVATMGAFGVRILAHVINDRRAFAMELRSITEMLSESSNGGSRGSSA